MPIIHPRPDETGKPVVIKHPSTPSSMEAWTDAAVTATAVPDGPVPDELNGIALSPWTDHPRTAEGWDYVDGLNEEIDEPPMEIGGKKLAAGAVILEPDGRVWLVHPTNQFGGYQATFPKGRVDGGWSFRAAVSGGGWGEAGRQGRPAGWLGDFGRTTPRPRLYGAKRIGGSPAAMVGEGQEASLVPLKQLGEMLNGAPV